MPYDLHRREGGSSCCTPPVRRRRFGRTPRHLCPTIRVVPDGAAKPGKFFLDYGQHLSRNGERVASLSQQLFLT